MTIKYGHESKDYVSPEFLKFPNCRPRYCPALSSSPIIKPGVFSVSSVVKKTCSNQKVKNLQKSDPVLFQLHWVEYHCINDHMSNPVLISGKEVLSLLQLEECIEAVENAFKQYAQGKASQPGVLAMHQRQGSFHIKAGSMEMSQPYFVAKVNGNFPSNRSLYNLPTIQGLLMLANADNGEVLAIMDSVQITILRTGAATAVAAKYLSMNDASTATIIGCGIQGRISLRMLMKVRPIKKVYIYDSDPEQQENFVKDLEDVLVDIHPVQNISEGLKYSDICITCTTSTRAFLKNEDMMPGTFIAAVGADNESKQELDPRLLSNNIVVTDVTKQCSKIGELHHAIDEGLMTVENVYAELGEIIAGIKKPPSLEKQMVIFDSTGMALQDVAAAAVVYERAIQSNSVRWNING